MARIITLEVSEELYTTLLQTAEAVGQSAAEWLLAQLPRLLPPTPAEKQRAWEQARQQVPNPVFELLLGVASQEHMSIEDLTIAWVAKYGQPAAPLPLTVEAHQTNPPDLPNGLASVSLGHPTDLDNDSIDADLTREYGSSHEEEP